MRQYPIKLPTGDEASMAEVSAINAAFFSGFITAMLNSKDKADHLTTAERCLLMAMAVDKSAMLRGAKDPEAVKTVLAILDEDDDGKEAQNAEG